MKARTTALCRHQCLLLYREGSHPFSITWAWNTEVFYRVTTLQEKEKTLIGSMQLLPLKVSWTGSKCFHWDSGGGRGSWEFPREECQRELTHLPLLSPASHRSLKTLLTLPHSEDDDRRPPKTHQPPASARSPCQPARKVGPTASCNWLHLLVFTSMELQLALLVSVHKHEAEALYLEKTKNGFLKLGTYHQAWRSECATSGWVTETGLSLPWAPASSHLKCPISGKCSHRGVFGIQNTNALFSSVSPITQAAPSDIGTEEHACITEVALLSYLTSFKGKL